MTTPLTLLANAAHKLLITANWWTMDPDQEEEKMLELATYDALGVWLPDLPASLLLAIKSRHLPTLAAAIRTIPGVWAEEGESDELAPFILVQPDDETLPNGKRWGDDRPFLRIFLRGDRCWLIAEESCPDHIVTGNDLWSCLMEEATLWSVRWEDLCEEAEEEMEEGVFAL